jgi:hypothetical protein
MDKGLLPKVLQQAQLPPVKQTMVLEPLENMDALSLSFLKDKINFILFIYLKDLEIGIETELEDFLNKFQISEATYILALVNKLKKLKFIKANIK